MQEWQRRRSNFNHQWLKNRLLQALDAAENLLKGRISGSAYLRDILDNEVQEWTVRRAEVLNLIATFTDEMSPRQLIDGPNFAGHTLEQKTYLKATVHEFWLLRYPIKEWLNAVSKAVEEVDIAYDHLEKLRSETSDLRMSPKLKQAILTFRSASRELAKAIEALPNRILAV